MAKEIELKLEVDPAHVEELVADGLLAREHRVERQISTYFDTPKGKLRREGWVLRVRQHGEGRTQTVKRSSDSAGLFDRDEWEMPVQGPQPDLQAIGETPLKELLKPRLFRHLIPIFRTDIERTMWQLRAGDSTIELSYDAGDIEAGAKSEPINELELELKDGEVVELFGIARKITRQIPARLGVESKSERGFDLAGGELGQPVKATRVALGSDATVAEGFVAIVTACLKHFRLNERVLVKDRHPEALHQLRVAVRRLRSAMWLFRPAVNDAKYEEMSDRLRQFTRELGAARNIDVILASMTAGDPARDAVGRDRSRLYGKILRKLDSPSFRVFLLDLLTWTHLGEWRQVKKAGKPLKAFALKRVDRLWSRIECRGDLLASLTADERHKLRIDTKKMRYSLEFLRDLLDGTGKEQRRFIGCAERIQDELGLLNDLATRQQLVGGTNWPLPERSLDAGRCLRSAKQGYREMQKIGAFWHRPKR